jgi:rubrerythrin
MISSLALLFTVLAIVATVIVFRQSAEHRKILDAAIAEYREVLNDFIADKKAQLDNIEQYFNKKIKESEDKLASATGAQKELIEDTIEKLKVERESVKSTVTSTTTAIPVSGHIMGIPADRFHRCSKCGFGYIVKNPYGGLLGIAMGVSVQKLAAKCPSCGNVDEV